MAQVHVTVCDSPAAISSPSAESLINGDSVLFNFSICAMGRTGTSLEGNCAIDWIRGELMDSQCKECNRLDFELLN